MMCPRKCSVEAVIDVGRSQRFSVTNTCTPLNSKTEHDLFLDFRTHNGMPSSSILLSSSYVCVHAYVVYLHAYMEVRGQPQVSARIFYLVSTQGHWLFPMCIARLAGPQADRFPMPLPSHWHRNGTGGFRWVQVLTYMHQVFHPLNSLPSPNSSSNDDTEPVNMNPSCGFIISCVFL